MVAGSVSSQGFDPHLLEVPDHGGEGAGTGITEIMINRRGSCFAMGNGFDPVKASAATLTDDRGARGLNKAIERKVLAASGMTWKGVTPSAGSRKRRIITLVRFTVLHRAGNL